jgi:hypothetical protein
MDQLRRNLNLKQLHRTNQEAEPRSSGNRDRAWRKKEERY